MPQDRQANAIIWWVRQDLRLADNPALHACVESGLPVIPVFIWNDTHSLAYGGVKTYGSAKKVWLHYSLATLARQLESLGSRLILMQGDPAEVLKDLAEECAAGSVHSNRCYEPTERALEKHIQQKNKSLVFTFHQGAHVLFEPEALKTGSGTPYQVFTPYYRKCLQQWSDVNLPLPKPTSLSAPGVWAKGHRLDDLSLLPPTNWGLESWLAGRRTRKKHIFC